MMNNPLIELAEHQAAANTQRAAIIDDHLQAENARLHQYIEHMQSENSEQITSLVKQYDEVYQEATRHAARADKYERLYVAIKNSGLRHNYFIRSIMDELETK